MSESKTFASFKTDGEGLFTAAFSSFAPVVDLQGDVTLASAIPIGREVPISGWNHASSSEGALALPVGRGIIRGDLQRAYVDGQFFTDTTPGLDTYRTVKNLGNLTQWSYSYRATDVSTSRSDLDQYGPTARRLLKSVDIIECSPVLVAAGRGTRTLVVKNDDLVDIDEVISENVQRLMGGADDEIYAIWQRMQERRPPDLTGIRFI